MRGGHAVGEEETDLDDHAHAHVLCFLCAVHGSEEFVCQFRSVTSPCFSLLVNMFPTKKYILRFSIFCFGVISEYGWCENGYDVIDSLSCVPGVGAHVCIFPSYIYILLFWRSHHFHIYIF